MRLRVLGPGYRLQCRADRADLSGCSPRWRGPLLRRLPGRLAVGDVALIDAARPVTYFANNGSEPWNTVTLNLPRDTLVSHLGFDPAGGICRRGGTTAGRLLFELIRNTDKGGGSASSPADSYMQLAIYD